ncbi:glycosyltransferase [Massilia sp. IC2-476]|uniref:glycosyltransferase n=1 Tax=Massilia sp. IC2-476 TaxID=2887199 RepID=UPI001D104C56|nr:glycosyltransferase [Massilia sp. IC2-476]MCC2971147.1 glycosyltransferase [Massilia sp. IC2-476]
MRIVIDFLDHPQPEPALLALARELAGHARDHELWVAAPSAPEGAFDALRLAFDGLVPRRRVRPFTLPAEPRLAALLRDQALASLVPDVVVTAGSTPAADSFASVALDGTAEALWQRVRDVSAPLAGAPGNKPRLAYVSPLPPEKSGIADYSAELVPELARYYEIELIVEQDRVSDARVERFTQRSAAWLREHAASYDRVLYHFGNSPAHRHMFELIRDVPGVVVLHDFYLSNVIEHLENIDYLPLGFTKALYESHGYTGLAGHLKLGRHPTVWQYPLNKGVLDNATGIIVHSEFPKGLAAEWYGEGAADDWRSIPLLRGKPEGAASPEARAAARARLGLKADDYVVCSFGLLGKTKLNEELLDAFLASPLAADPHCSLVFVGENDAGKYGANLSKKIRAARCADRIRITGFVDPATYADYLAGGDCAVQLRGSSRGETSAAVLDCLLYGVPTIVNAHGSTASIDDSLLLKLRDGFACEELAEALGRLRADSALRARLSQRALAYMESQHAPGHAGRMCMEAIEHFATRGARAGYRQLIEAAARACPMESLPALAGAIAANRAASGPRQLLVDVSALVQHDLKTGIQRVVRSILLALIASPPPGFRIEPVFGTGGNRPYHYARNWALNLVGETGLSVEDAPVELRPGDVFLGLDLYISGVAQNEQLLQSMRDRGVEIYFVVYDLLPVLRPDVFPFGTEDGFADFLRTVHRVSDGVLCISRAVADEYAAWTQAQGLRRTMPLQLGWFHLGADINASAPSTGLPPNASQVLDALGQRPSFLMVGTVEPRKGHAQTLAAFDLLWERGVDVNLVVVGKQGWMMEAVAERMNNHPEKAKRLFWMAGISDEMLLKLYGASAALLSPSEGEGFGLPLIEAAQYGIPIIARSLPVFREVAGEHAWYFDGLAPDDLAQAIEAWLERRREGSIPESTGMPWLTWNQSARQVLAGLVRQRWYRTLPPSAPETTIDDEPEGDAKAA